MAMRLSTRLMVTLAAVTIVGVMAIVVRSGVRSKRPAGPPGNRGPELGSAVAGDEGSARSPARENAEADKRPGNLALADELLGIAQQRGALDAGVWTATKLSEFEVRILAKQADTKFLADGKVSGPELYDLVLADLKDPRVDGNDIVDVQRRALSRIVTKLDECMVNHFLRATGTRVERSQVVEEATEDLAGGIKAVTFRYTGPETDGVPRRFRLMLGPADQGGEVEARKGAFVRDCARRVEMGLAREYVKKSPDAQHLPPELLAAFVDSPSRGHLASLLKSQMVCEIRVPSLQVEPLLNQILRLRQQGILVRSTAEASSEVSGGESRVGQAKSASEATGRPVSREDVLRIQDYYRKNQVCGFGGDQVAIDGTSGIRRATALDIVWDCNRFLMSSREHAAGSDEKAGAFDTLCDGSWLRVREADGQQHKTRMSPSSAQDDGRDVGGILSQRLLQADRSGYICESGVRYAVFVFQPPVEDTSVRRAVGYYIRLDDNHLAKVRTAEVSPAGLNTKITRISSLYFAPVAEQRLAAATLAFDDVESRDSGDIRP